MRCAVQVLQSVVCSAGTAVRSAQYGYCSVGVKCSYCSVRCAVQVLQCAVQVLQCAVLSAVTAVSVCSAVTAVCGV